MEKVKELAMLIYGNDYKKYSKVVSKLPSNFSESGQITWSRSASNNLDTARRKVDLWEKNLKLLLESDLVQLGTGRYKKIIKKF